MIPETPGLWPDSKHRQEDFMRTVTAVMGGVGRVRGAFGCTQRRCELTPSVSKDALQKDIADQLTEAGERDR